MFLAIFSATSFTATFDDSALPTTPFLRWLMTASYTLVQEILDVLRRNVWKHGTNVVSTMIGMACDKVLRGLATKLVGRILRSVMNNSIVYMHESNYEKIFNIIFLDKKSSLSNIPTGSYLQLVMSRGTMNAPVRNFRFLVTPAVLGVHFYFHSLRYFELTCKERPFHVTVSYKAGMCFAVRTRAVLTKIKTLQLAGDHGSMTSFKLPFHFFDYDEDHFCGLSKREKGSFYPCR